MSVNMKKSSRVMIRPHCDGLLMERIQDVAGDSLSVLSIKEDHSRCRSIVDPKSSKPVISCTQGFKARNSYQNLHKPDLRKLKGLDCTTTESVVHIFQKHNSNKGRKLSYKKRILRLLKFLVPKSKSRPRFVAQNLEQDETESWFMNKCLLAGICKEQEIKLNVKTAETLMKTGSNDLNSESSIEGMKDAALFTTGHSLLHKQTCKIITEESSETECAMLNPPQIHSMEQVSSVLSSLNQSHESLETHSEVDCYEQSETEYVDASEVPSSTDSRIRHTSVDSHLVSVTALDSPTKEVIFLFSEIIKEMRIIEDYIRFFVMHFYKLKEELENLPVSNKTPSDCILKFCEQIHSIKINSHHVYDEMVIAQWLYDGYLDTNSIVKVKNNKKLCEHSKTISLEESEGSSIFTKEEINNVMDWSKSETNDCSSKVLKMGSVLFCDCCYITSDSDLDSRDGYCHWVESDLHSCKDKIEVLESEIPLREKNTSSINCHWVESDLHSCKDKIEVLESEIPLRENNTSSINCHCIDSDSHDIKEEIVVLESEIPLRENNTSSINCHCIDSDSHVIKEEIEVLESEILPRENNTLLIDVQFFERVQKEFIHIFGEDYGLIYSLPNDKQFIQQKQGTIDFDQSVIEETINIIHTIDNFITNEFLSSQVNYNFNPCSILEMINEKFDNDFVRNKSESSQSLQSLHIREPTRNFQTKCEIITDSNLDTYSQPSSSSNLSLYPEDELKDNENISLAESSEGNTLLQSCTTFIVDKISDKSSTDSENAFCVESIRSTEINQIEKNIDVSSSVLKGTIPRSVKIIQEYQLTESNLFEDTNFSVFKLKEKALDDCSLVGENMISSSDKIPDEEMSKPKQQQNLTNTFGTEVVQIPEKDYANQTHSQLIFSSTKVKLDLTNPILKRNNK